MRNSLLIFCFLLVGFSVYSQQTNNPFGLAIQDREAYKAAIVQNAENTLVEIKKEIPNIVLDIRYATSNNFMKQVMYQQARAFARKPVVEQLKNVQKVLNKEGYGLKIFDAYRPYAVTILFYEKASDKRFVANPNKGSRHNRG
ncbi:MAG: D-alanyl-D-alanine dipeptidase, partial [Pedobacter sp.]